MKTEVFRADERGTANYGWLKANYSFSFANYYNPERIHFGKLRVLNDDIIDAGMGFDTHPHDNMEIVSIPISGAMAHKDSTGHQAVINVGDVQIMSAGSGVFHSEFNASKTEPVNLLQTWVMPDKKNISPRYDQKSFDLESKRNSFVTVVSPKESLETLWINQDAYYSIGKFDANLTIAYTLNNPKNGVYVFVIDGSIEIDAKKLHLRGAMGIKKTNEFLIKMIQNSHVLLIEVPV